MANKHRVEAFETAKQDPTNWSRSRYQAAFNDGVERLIDGISNGSFGLSEDYVLTHLTTGFKVARFRNEESGKAAGDYLRAVYAEEFAALDDSIEPAMTWEQYRTLPSARILSSKIQVDAFFNALLTDYKIQEKEE